MAERKAGGSEKAPLSAKPEKKEEPKKPELPKVIRVLENKCLAHGFGLITLRKDQRIDDPWVIHAVVANNVDHAVLE